MALELVLIRHGKSSWKDGEASDHDRVLNARGRRSADAVGAWLAARGAVPDTVLCSSAARTRETWERIAAVLPGAPAATLLPELYLATPQTLLGALRAAEGRRVAMLAHNPGIGAFAGMVLAAPPAHAGFARFPTLATLVARFGIEAWPALEPGSGTAAAFLVPRELTD